MSMTPALSSPALTSTVGPVVGNFFNSNRVFLYEQCSLHITEKIPSSVKFGSRPRISLIRPYSSSVRPCLAMTSLVIAGSVMLRKDFHFSGKELRPQGKRAGWSEEPGGSDR